MPTTQRGVPYVVGSDVVGAYPETSRTLADYVDAERGRTDGLNRVGSAMRYDSGAGGFSTFEVLTSAGTDGMALTIDGNQDTGALAWQHNSTWHTILLIRWNIQGANEPLIVSTHQWDLNNPRNVFNGYFVGTVPLAQATPLLAPAQPIGQDPDLEAGQPIADPPDTMSVDLTATLAQLAARVLELEARIEQLEAQA